MRLLQLIKMPLRPVKKVFLDFRAKYNLSKKKEKVNGKIKVVFICQCQHIWNKLRYLAKTLSEDSNFEVVLYIVKDPLDDSNGETIFENYAKEHGIKYYFYEDVKLKDLNPLYVIYPRPYDVWLNEDIRSNVVCSYANTVYIPYGYSLMELGKVNLNSSFTRNIKIFFADMGYAYDYFKRQHKKQIKREIQFAYNLGHPYLDELGQIKENCCQEKSAFLSLKNQGLNVIWTPRWTVKDKLGGSNFFRYIDGMFEEFIDNKEYNFVFRPHPYAFDNYVKEGLMTEGEKEGYLSKINTSKNSVYDFADDYFATFLDSNLLITDISSIIAEYLLTKKPVIFCHNEKNEILNYKMKEILTVFYNAYSMEDIRSFIEQIKSGNDYLKEEREKFVDKFLQEQIGTAERIKNVLKDFC